MTDPLPPTAKLSRMDQIVLEEQERDWGGLWPDMPSPAEIEREQARRNPERDTLLLAAAGAAVVLGARHSTTRAFAKASTTMAKVDLWHARLALKTLRPDQREAMAAAADIVI